MFLMTQIVVYQHADKTLGFGYTNDLWDWWRSTKSKKDDEIALIAVFPIAWEYKTSFIHNVNKAIKDTKTATNSYKISPDDLYKAFSTTIQNLKSNTYIPSAMVDTSRYLPKFEIWNFDYTPTKTFEIRVNT